MRAFAVLQMVQGHTIHVILANEYRDTVLPVYNIWLFMRGMTAPIFMFTAGTVFTYLFRYVKRPFNENPRVKKGIKRGLLLIIIGYLLHYPTWTIFIFSDVTERTMNSFLMVDVLQLIGVSLLILLVLLYIAEKTRINDYIVFAGTSAIIFFIAPITNRVDWLSILPRFFAGYFYDGSGSLFPVFPWAGYVISGGVLGTYLARNPMAFKSAGFSIRLAIFGLIILGSSLLSDFITTMLGNPVIQAQYSANTILFRVGFVLLLNALVSYISLKVERIPQLIILVGRNTLLIYVVHLIILYGSSWNPGINMIWGSRLDGWLSAVFALVMITVMTFMVIIIHKFKIKDKQLVT